MTEFPNTGQPSAPGVPTDDARLHWGRTHPGTRRLADCGGWRTAEASAGGQCAQGTAEEALSAVSPAISATRHLTAATSATTCSHPTPHPGRVQGAKIKMQLQQQAEPPAAGEVAQEAS